MVSSRVSFADVLCSLGPTDEDIEMAGESLTVVVITGEVPAKESNKEHAGKDPDVTVTTGEAVIGVPSQGHVVSSTVHDAHHSKEPLGMITLSCLYSVKQASHSIILDCVNAFCYCWGHNHASFCRAIG